MPSSVLNFAVVGKIFNHNEPDAVPALLKLPAKLTEALLVCKQPIEANVGRNSSVGIQTLYGLDGPG
jgi:hypothetical protein